MNYPLSQLFFYLNEGYPLPCRACWPPEAIPDAGGRKIPCLPVERFRPVQSAPAEMTLAVFVQAVREGLPLGLRSVKLTGGEPLLHAHFDALLDVLEENHLGFELETGGDGLNAARANRLARMAVRLVNETPYGLKPPPCSVSLGMFGADAAVHDRLRGEPGSFDAAIHAAQLLAQAGLAPIMVFSLARQNIHQIPEMIHLSDELGAAAACFQVTQPDAPGEAQGLLVEEWIALGRRFERQFVSQAAMRVEFDQPPAFRGIGMYARTGPLTHCGLLNSLSVLPGGEYALCGVPLAAFELTFGQVGVDPLARVWNEHPVLEYLRTGLPDRLEGVCSRCLLKASCRGKCVAQNYCRSGSFWSPHWFCEAADHAGLFPASRLKENRLWN